VGKQSIGVASPTEAALRIVALGYRQSRDRILNRMLAETAQMTLEQRQQYLREGIRRVAYEIDRQQSECRAANAT